MNFLHQNYNRNFKFIWIKQFGSRITLLRQDSLDGKWSIKEKVIRYGFCRMNPYEPGVDGIGFVFRERLYVLFIGKIRYD